MLREACATSATTHAPPALAGRRRGRIYASPEIEDRLALGGDVAVLFLYSYTQKSLDTIYAVTANYVEGIEVDEMDCFRDRRSLAAAALSLAWLCGALPQGAFRFDVTRGGVNNALTTVAKCGCLSVAAVVLLLVWARAAAAGVPLSPQDAGFAAGILPIVGAWRYVARDAASCGLKGTPAAALAHRRRLSCVSGRAEVPRAQSSWGAARSPKPSSYLASPCSLRAGRG